eukprot:scaffold51431_cov26-Tisochrysis_lutea.AAC.1
MLRERQEPRKMGRKRRGGFQRGNTCWQGNNTQGPLERGVGGGGRGGCCSFVPPDWAGHAWVPEAAATATPLQPPSLSVC